MKKILNLFLCLSAMHLQNKDPIVLNCMIIQFYFPLYHCLALIEEMFNLRMDLVKVSVYSVYSIIYSFQFQITVAYLPFF